MWSTSVGHGNGVGKGVLCDAEDWRRYGKGILSQKGQTWSSLEYDKIKGVAGVIGSEVELKEGGWREEMGSTWARGIINMNDELIRVQKESMQELTLN